MPLELVREDVCTLSDNQLKGVEGGTVLALTLAAIIIIESCDPNTPRQPGGPGGTDTRAD